MAVWILAAIAIVIVGGALYIRSVGHDPALWHVDPLIAEGTGRPNEAFALPQGAGEAAITTEVRPLSPEDLARRFHAVATAAPRVSVVAGGPDEAFTTYVQRSALMGWPDYVSVRAVPRDGGAALAIWSRARFGYSDMGVNRARLEDWLAALREQAPD